MLTILLVVQIIIAFAMCVVILLQKSSGNGLSGLGGGGGGDSLMTGRASANALTKTTAVLATFFMINSLAMATITSRSSDKSEQIIEEIISEDQVEQENTEPAVPTSE